MKYTIEDLKNGKCAVINDGTLEELREVLRMAFPKASIFISGSSIFYFRDSDCHDHWCADSLKPYIPTQSVKDFLKPDLGQKIKELKDLAKSQGMECEVVMKEKERIRVNHAESKTTNKLTFHFSISGNGILKGTQGDCYEYIRTQLEKYLNGETDA